MMRPRRWRSLAFSEMAGLWQLEYDSFMDPINGDLTTINGDLTTINGDLTTINGDLTTINGDLTTRKMVI